MVIEGSLSKGKHVVVQLQGNHQGAVDEGTACGHTGSIQYRKSRGSSYTGQPVVEICNEVHMDSVLGAMQCTTKRTNTLRNYFGSGNGIQKESKIQPQEVQVAPKIESGSLQRG